MFAVYKWQQDAVGWGTRYPIATFQEGTGYDVRFSPDNAYIVTTTATTVKMFPFTFGGIGTVVSGGPSKDSSNPNAGLSWHPDQNAVGWGDNRQATAPTMHVTRWTDDDIIDTRVTRLKVVESKKAATVIQYEVTLRRGASDAKILVDILRGCKSVQEGVVDGNWKINAWYRSISYTMSVKGYPKDWIRRSNMYETGR
jgi:hypothetical protein